MQTLTNYQKQAAKTLAWTAGLLLSLSWATAQMPAAITLEPADATAYDDITLYFDPALACFQSGSLAGLPSIAMHSGVTDIWGYTWQFIVEFNQPGANGQWPILQPTGDGRYSITFRPVDFYGLPNSFEAKEICAVFNNGSNWNNDGRDFIANTEECCDFFIPLSGDADNWEWQNPCPCGGNYRSVAFTDQDHGWAVADNGIMVATVDGGETWEIKDAGTKGNLRKVIFLDDQHGWALATRNDMVEQVLATVDGGETWSVRSMFMNTYVDDLFFVDLDHGWLTIFEQVYATCDGGFTWNYIYSFSNWEQLISFMFTDPLNGWGLSYENIYHTVDGGAQWNEVQIPGFDNASFNKLFFTDDQHGWITGINIETWEGIVLRTTTGGSTWIAANIGWDWPDKIVFADDYNGWILYPYFLKHTTNGGITWDDQYPTGAYDICDFDFVDENNGWIVGYGGTILHTSNGGSDWTSQSGVTGTALNDVCFTDEEKGWAVGYGMILKTVDGGETWEVESNIQEGGYVSIDFADANNGWILREDGNILHTVNGGLSWGMQYLPPYGWYQSIFFNNATDGWAAGGNGMICHSSNGGSVWTQTQTGCQEMFSDIFFINPQTGWATGSNVVYGTTDGGSTWVELFSLGGVNLQSVVFLDELEGFVVGIDWFDYSGTILHTVDGGQYWNFQSVPSPLTDLCFIDQQNAFAVGFDGFVVRSQDGGISWKSDGKYGNNLLTAVSFFDSGHGWAVGENCTILHYIGEGLVSVPENAGKRTGSPVNVYPNPASSEVTIAYALDSDSWVTIKIFNTVGQVIRVLQDGEQPAGEQVMVMDLAGLSEGVYFYRLNIGPAQYSGKLVVR